MIAMDYCYGDSDWPAQSSGATASFSIHFYSLVTKQRTFTAAIPS